jgi:anti-anti-sigma regulatory factor
MAQDFSFTSDSVGAHTDVLTLEGQCDLSAAREAEQWIVAAIDAGRTDIVFDLRGVSKLVPSVVDALFQGMIHAKSKSGSLVLIRPNAYAWALFEESGIDEKFASFRDLEHALMKVPEPGEPL